MKKDSKELQKKVHVISLGCSKNLVDSEVMLGRLSSYALTSDIQEADVIIINTCGFIEAAKSESLGHIFEALRVRKNGALLVASGCLVARYATQIKEMIPEIDILTGVGDFDKIDSMITTKNALNSDKVFLNNNEKRIITGSNIHAYVKISEGCNQSCSFCAIPSFKGRLQSRSIDSILREIENLSAQGYQDISFIAQDTSSFLRDKGVRDGLLKLINAIEVQGAIKSARILYLYPSSTSFELLSSIADSKIFQSYFDMPIQHISQSVLRDMNRSYGDVTRLLEYMRRLPNSFVRSSIIVAYPSENESDFMQLCEFLESFSFDRLNVFEYSSEEGTKAGSMPILPKAIRSSRIKKVQKIIAKQQKKILKNMLNTRIHGIIEGKSEISPYFYSARDVRWAKEIDGEILINDIVDATLGVESSGTMKSGFSLESSGAMESSKVSGYYDIHITDFKDNILIGKAMKV